MVVDVPHWEVIHASPADVAATPTRNVIATPSFLYPGTALRTFPVAQALFQLFQKCGISLQPPFCAGQSLMRFLPADTTNLQETRWALPSLLSSEPVDLPAIRCYAVPIFLGMLLEMTRECDFDEMLECLIVHMSADDWNGK
jgi:hypothetical protein